MGTVPTFAGKWPKLDNIKYRQLPGKVRQNFCLPNQEMYTSTCVRITSVLALGCTVYFGVVISIVFLFYLTTFQDILAEAVLLIQDFSYKQFTFLDILTHYPITTSSISSSIISVVLSFVLVELSLFLVSPESKVISCNFCKIH